MSATRTEIAELGKNLLDSHRADALALASLLKFLGRVSHTTEQDAAAFNLHAETFWQCIQAHMDRQNLTRTHILSASNAIDAASTTLAMLNALPD